MNVNKKKVINWDLVRDKMIKDTADEISKTLGVPITLDIFEDDKIPEVPADCGGFVVCIITKEGEFYIDHIFLRRQSKEKMAYTLAHELGHIKDFVKLKAQDLIDVTLFERSGVSKLSLHGRRVVWESEKRAFSEGLTLLQKAGVVHNYYLQRFLQFRRDSLVWLTLALFNEKKKRKKKLV